jgi:hypothetical protein
LKSSRLVVSHRNTTENRSVTAGTRRVCQIKRTPHETTHSKTSFTLRVNHLERCPTSPLMPRDIRLLSVNPPGWQSRFIFCPRRRRIRDLATATEALAGVVARHFALIGSGRPAAESA